MDFLISAADMLKEAIYGEPTEKTWLPHDNAEYKIMTIRKKRSTLKIKLLYIAEPKSLY